MPPPIVDICDPMPPPRAYAALNEMVEQRAMQRTVSFFMPKLLSLNDR
jgi:hypothetical protein